MKNCIYLSNARIVLNLKKYINMWEGKTQTIWSQDRGKVMIKAVS